MREQGYTYKAIGEAVGVHPRTIAHWAQVAAHKGEKAAIAGGQRGVRQGDRRSLSSSQEVLIRTLLPDQMPDQLKLGLALRSEDRRVGIECVRTCSARCSPFIFIKQNINIL